MTPIFDALARHARQRPDAPAFRDGTRQISWADLAEAVSRSAAGFASGPRTVGLRLAGLDYVIADLAATLAGRRVVPVPGFFSFGQHGGDDRGGDDRGGDDRGTDDYGGRGRGRNDQPSGTAGGGSAGGGAVGGGQAGSRPTEIERSARGIEVTYADGWREELEYGRYELKDTQGRTVVERTATGQDVERLSSFSR
ncbi:hypothetical protein [Paracoccus gahaiensis]|nr:hypothetical protein [Paracoccus gahaiensis]